MNDIETGLAPDDGDLFASVVSEDGDSQTSHSSPETEPHPHAAHDHAQHEPSPPHQNEPAIPPSRLREEAEARRAAERRADALERQMAGFREAMTSQRPRSDMLENPSGFVQEEVGPMLDPVQKEIGSLREFYSKRDAVREFGPDKVITAFHAMNDAACAGDPDARGAVNRVKASLDPFGDIVRWHHKVSVLDEIGDDVEAYKARVIVEALQNPEVQRRAMQMARAHATANGNTITQFARPAAGSHPFKSLPSITRVGSVALPQGQDGDSDDDLFSKTTHSKRGP